jgi:hypothetical protein
MSILSTLLGDPCYMSEDMFVMRCIRRCELVLRVHMDVVKVYNKIDACLTFHSILRFGLKFKV